MGLLSHCVSLFILIVASFHTCCTVKPEKNFFKKVQVSPSIKLGCVLEHCVPEFIACGLSKDCRAGLACSEACFKEWDNDTSPEKFTVQNCSNKCVVTFLQVKALNNLMACLADNKCYSLPPIPSTCKAPNVKPIKPLSAEDLQGHWWVVRGYHPVYDCYPCQQPDFERLNKTAWSYMPKYEAYKVDGSLVFMSDQKFVMPQTTPGKNISFTYNDMGIHNHETWWLIDKADDSSYVQMYYCGNTLQWNYEGAIVFARNRTLSAADYTKIEAAYKQAVGIDLQRFCYPSTSKNCPT